MLVVHADKIHSYGTILSSNTAKDFRHMPPFYVWGPIRNYNFFFFFFIIKVSLTVMVYVKGSKLVENHEKINVWIKGKHGIILFSQRSKLGRQTP